MGQFTRSGEGDREREEEMGNLLGLGRGTGRGRRKWDNLLGLGRGTGRGRRKWAIYIILQIKYPQIIVFLCFHL